MTNKNYIAAGVAAIVLSGALWWFIGSANRSATDPFADLAIPSKLQDDEPVKKRVQAEIDGAKAMYKKDPKGWNTWIAIGNVRSLVEDYRGAISAYQKSIDIQPNNVLGYRNIAVAYKYNLRDFASAEPFFRLAINNNPQEADLYIELAQLLDKQLKLPDKAEAAYIEGLKATQNYPDIMVALAEFYKNYGQTAKYKETVKKLLALYPKNEAYQKAYGGVK